jgi:hypothetical protein
MLLLGRQRCRTCQGWTRRALLEARACSVFGLSLADLLRGRALGGTASAGSARSVLLLWLWGGPAHLDTWEPKPAAPLEFRGPFTPIATSVAGTRIAELFPKVARQAHRFALLRSLHTGSNDHGVAGTIGLTGSAAGGVGLDGKPLPGAARPAVGSVVARARGGGAGLPPFTVIGGRLHQGKKAIVGEGGGAPGAFYDPFRLEYDPVRGTRIPALQLAADLTPERLGDRRRLLVAFDQAARRADAARAARALDDYRGQALAMLTDPAAARVFDLGAEKDAVKDRYGRTRFGQSCLLGRRLVEHGVPFVQVNWSDHVEPEEDAGDGGWDHHYRNFQIMQDRHAPWLDQALSSLVARRQAHRLRQHARRQSGDLYDRRRRQGPPAPDERSRPGQQPDLVARRQKDRLCQRSQRQLRDPRHERRRHGRPPADQPSGPRLLAGLVSRRQAHRLHVQSRRQLRDLRHGRRRQRPAQPDVPPGAGQLRHWSPDGKRIAFVSTRDGGHDVYVIDVP